MNTAENDEVGAGIGRLLREFERIAGIIGVLEHLVALIVVTQNSQAIAENLLGCHDALVTITVIQQAELIEFENCGQWIARFLGAASLSDREHRPGRFHGFFRQNGVPHPAPLHYAPLSPGRRRRIIDFTGDFHESKL